MRLTHHLYYGDNLRILRDEIASETVDLIYLDPPFNSSATYNVLFKAPSGEGSQAQIEAFEDSWHWNDNAEEAYWQALHGTNTDAAKLLEAMRGFLGQNDMMAYLAMMAVRLIELHRVLKPTGSLYLHCDPTASHYLKLVLDAIFGKDCLRNEIVWRRSHPKGHAFTRFATSHDVIFYYAKNPRKATWNPSYSRHDPATVNQQYSLQDETGRRYQLTSLLNPNPDRPNLTYEFLGVTKVWRWTKDRMNEEYEKGRIIVPRSGKGIPRYKRYLDEQEGVPVGDFWDDIGIAAGTERLGYPTQKPLALLERIIAASSNEGDVVLDPFCGCGTTVHAAQKLGRQWIGIDVTHLAISLIERRLREAFPGVKFEVHGVPTDAAGAAELAAKDKYEFQKWAITLVPDAQPWKGGRKGADTGIDGIVYLRVGKSQSHRGIIEVKGGERVGVDVIHKLKSVVDRENALVGLLISLNPPSREAEKEAAAAGFAQIDMGTGTMRLRKIQILTVEQLLAGTRPELPLVDSTAFRRAKTENTSSQSELDL
ncbi:MAG TPA: site-specific DNA-methyltransferase [Bauldia sp.]|nr:site-specific DNA-methyltransferase [Bauldia sp.]